MDYVLSTILTVIINDITLLYNDSKNTEILNDNKLNTALDIYANSFFQKVKYFINSKVPSFILLLCFVWSYFE